MKKAFKTILSLMLAVIVVVGVIAPIAPTASALKIRNFYTDSDIWLVDSNTHSTSSTIYLYGRADYICLKLKQTDAYKDIFYFRLYSDSKKNNEVLSYSTEYSTVGTKYITLPISFDDLKSGTYYAETYVYKRCLHGPTGVQLPDSYVPRDVDEDTRRTYKVVINKKGTSINEMNTVMYGYENTEKGPKIYWYSVPGATGYYLYRKSPKTGKYSKIKTVKDSGKKLTSYVDGTYKGENATREYKVVAYKGSLKTPYSLKAMKVKILKTPTITIKPQADNYVKVSWSKVASGAEYTLLMRTGDGDWSKVKTTESRSASVNMNKRSNNKAYYFTVVANVDGVNSGYNVKGKAYKNIKAPELEACTFSEDGGITVNWKKVTGADEYIVYKKVNKEWQKLATVAGDKASYTDTQSDCYAYNTYTVKSVSNGAAKSYSSKGKSIIKFEKVVFNDVVEDADKLKVSWINPIENQKCDYQVYVKKGENWEYFDTFGGNSIYHYFENNDLEYAFRVRATYKGINGPFNELSYTYYPTMNKPDVVADEKGALVSWGALKGVDGYVLYKENAEGEFDVIAKTADTSFLDTEIENDIAYSYKVAYIYKGEIISKKESEKITVTFIDELVNIKPDTYKPRYDDYTVSIADFVADGSKYQVYKKVDNKWVREYGAYFYSGSGGMLIPAGSGVTEYAVLKIYPDGRKTRLPLNGFIIDSAGCAKDVKFSSDKNTVTFSWDPEMFDADKVVIYRNGEYIGEADRADGVFVEENVESNVDHYYTICTQNGYFIANNSGYKNFTYLEEPAFTVNPTKGGVVIRWGGIDADCYVDIYRATGSSTTFKKIDSGYHNWEYIVDDGVKNGTTYRYAIVLRDDFGNKSTYDPSGKTIKYISTPLFSSVKNVKNGLKISWSEVSKVDGYVLSYKKDGEWHVLADVASDVTSYVDQTVQSGKRRIYKVQAYSGDNKSSYETKTAYYIGSPTITSVSSTTKQMKINFTPVEGATKYKVYYKTGSDDKWHTLGTTTKTSYTHKTQRPGVKFTYAVSAVWSTGGKDYTSYKSGSKTAKNLATPTLDTISSTKSGIKLTWKVTSYATGYNVYRKNSDGEFEKIAYVKGNSSVSYVDKTAKKGKTYTYTVRATYGNCISAYNKTGLTCKDKY